MVSPAVLLQCYSSFIGFAYIEFADKDSVQTAMALDESLFRGRQIKVNPKRTNRPGLSTTNRGGFRGRGGRGARFARGAAYFGYRPARRARAYRRPFYSPYWSLCHLLYPPFTTPFLDLLFWKCGSLPHFFRPAPHKWTTVTDNRSGNLQWTLHNTSPFYTV